MDDQISAQYIAAALIRNEGKKYYIFQIILISS